MLSLNDKIKLLQLALHLWQITLNLWQIPAKISYLLFRCTIQDVHITPLGTENTTKELKRERKK